MDLAHSFERRPLADRLQESRRVGVRDTTISVGLRSMYLDRDNLNGSQSEAWVLGGSFAVKTGYFFKLLSFGVTGFTSQRLYGPPDKDGTKLLQTGQHPYSVIGELYGQVRLTDQITAAAGRRELANPFLNAQDSLETPNTFQIYSIQGLIGSTDRSALHFGGGYVDKIKERNSTEFVSMAEAAGAPVGVNRGVYTAGALYHIGELSVGAIGYHSPDIIHITYTELKYASPLAHRLGLRFEAQYTGQHSTGDNLLTGTSFATSQYGLKGELSIGTALLTVARTITGTGANVRNPWGSYPGYTSVQVENFYRAGEDATLLRAAYNFPKSTGLSLYGLWVHGSRPHASGQYARQEYDLNLQWTAQRGTLKGLALRARYAHITQAGPSDEHEDELRLILNYPLR